MVKNLSDLTEWIAFMDPQFCSFYECGIRLNLLKSRGQEETLRMDARVYGGLKNTNPLFRYFPYRLKLSAS